MKDNTKNCFDYGHTKYLNEGSEDKNEKRL